MMCVSFNGNPCTTIICCYSPTNASEEMDIISFYNQLSLLVWHIPKHKILIIGGDMIIQIGQGGNDKFYKPNLPNRNEEYLADFPIGNRLACVNTKFQKKGQKTMDINYLNNSKAQLDYIFMNKKWIELWTVRHTHFWRNTFRSQNCLGKDLIEFMQK